MSRSSSNDRPAASPGLRRWLPAQWLVCYDVSDDQRRRRVERVLRGVGRRVQESVFECRLTTTLATTTRRRIGPLIDPATDSVRWYRVCDACAAETLHLDVRPRQRDYGFTIV